MDMFGIELIAKNFEDEEIDGRILLSSTVRTNEAMERLGLTTIGKRGKFLEKTKELAGMVLGYLLEIFSNYVNHCCVNFVTNQLFGQTISLMFCGTVEQRLF